MTSAPRLKVGLIGAGRVGTALARRLQASEHPIVMASATSDQSVARSQRWLPATDFAAIPDVVAAAELLLIAIPDDALASVVSGIAQTVGFRPGQFVVHTSGRYGLEVLEPALAQGAIAIALHPAMTFTGADSDFDRLQDCPFAVTTRPEWRVAAEALVIEMGGEPMWLEDDHRAAYHAALSHASNHLNTVISQSTELLRHIGVENAGSFISPLVHASLENALAIGAAGLTGPVSRGDVETVEQHLVALEGHGMLATYKALALATVDSALSTKKINADVAAKMREVLK